MMARPKDWQQQDYEDAHRDQILADQWVGAEDVRTKAMLIRTDAPSPTPWHNYNVGEKDVGRRASMALHWIGSYWRDVHVFLNRHCLSAEFLFGFGPEHEGWTCIPVCRWGEGADPNAQTWPATSSKLIDWDLRAALEHYRERIIKERNDLAEAIDFPQRLTVPPNYVALLEGWINIAVLNWEVKPIVHAKDLCGTRAQLFRSLVEIKPLPPDHELLAFHVKDHQWESGDHGEWGDGSNKPMPRCYGERRFNHPE